MSRIASEFVVRGLGWVISVGLAAWGSLVQAEPPVIVDIQAISQTDQTVGVGQPVPNRFAVLATSGPPSNFDRVAGVTVTFSLGCKGFACISIYGHFVDGSQAADVVTDSNGIATAPEWIAPDAVGEGGSVQALFPFQFIDVISFAPDPDQVPVWFNVVAGGGGIPPGATSAPTLSSAMLLLLACVLTVAAFVNRRALG